MMTRECRFRTEAKIQAYSINLSALISSDCGMVRPSALTVLRLIINSNFVGCSTGRSAGLAPLNTKAEARRGGAGICYRRKARNG